jgi:hypothetical protein
MNTPTPTLGAAVWKAIETAPKDGTMVRLLVDYSDDGDNPLEDADRPTATIGFNSLEDTGDDLWQFAGWSWHQDCFCEGHGRPVGWLPLPDVSIYDENAGMGGDGEHMTAAENVLAYLAVSVCGAIDDEPISPLKAQRIIEAKLTEADALRSELTRKAATFNGMSAPEGWYISGVSERLQEWRTPSERWLVTLNRNSDIRTVSGVGATDRDAFFAAVTAAMPPHNLTEGDKP